VGIANRAGEADHEERECEAMGQDRNLAILVRAAPDRNLAAILDAMSVRPGSPGSFGRYELLRPIARGGMAEVYLARRRAGGIEKLVVVKRIRAERAADPRFLELFVREARLTMGLTHQNIVQVFDFGRADDQVFLVMELVDGRDLGSTLARPGVAPLPAVVAAFVAAECCQALAYAHRYRRPGGEPLEIVHRDVTPRNVLMSWSGEVKLADFGIATLAGDDARHLVGTAGNMAPEQARREPVDPRADLYALGLVLREALTGERGRPGDDRDRLIASARTGALAPWPAGHAAELRAIVDRATAPDREARFPDAGSMLAALDAFIVGARAIEPGEAPARRLADWLAAAWTGARELDQRIPSSGLGELVGFGNADDEAGTGTMRSLAPTVGVDEAAAGEAPRDRRWLLGGAAVVLVAAGSVLAVRAAGSREPVTPALIAVTPRDAAVDALESDGAIDAQVVAVDAAQIDPVPRPVGGAVRLPAPRNSAQPVDAQSPRRMAAPAPDAAPPLAKRHVRINARPWAKFTIDGDPAEYETISVVELRPGTHRIRFFNPELRIERELTVVVPADRDLDVVEDLRH
jgi:tRNA A-37 threonylcarbamoyl transferase component Bud32